MFHLLPDAIVECILKIHLEAAIIDDRRTLDRHNKKEHLCSSMKRTFSIKWTCEETKVKLVSHYWQRIVHSLPELTHLFNKGYIAHKNVRKYQKDTETFVPIHLLKSLLEYDIRTDSWNTTTSMLKTLATQIETHAISLATTALKLAKHRVLGNSTIKNEECRWNGRFDKNSIVCGIDVDTAHSILPCTSISSEYQGWVGLFAASIDDIISLEEQLRIISITAHKAGIERFSASFTVRMWAYMSNQLKTSILHAICKMKHISDIYSSDSSSESEDCANSDSEDDGETADTSSNDGTESDIPDEFLYTNLEDKELLMQLTDDERNLILEKRKDDIKCRSQHQENINDGWEESLNHTYGMKIFGARELDSSDSECSDYLP